MYLTPYANSKGILIVLLFYHCLNDLSLSLLTIPIRFLSKALK